MQGPKTVQALLNGFDLTSETVLVSREDQLLPDGERLHPDDVSSCARLAREVEHLMKGRVGRPGAVIAVRYHNAGFCKEHFVAHVHRQCGQPTAGRPGAFCRMKEVAVLGIAAHRPS